MAGRYGSFELEGIHSILKASARICVRLWRIKNKSCFHVNIFPGIIGVVFDEKVNLIFMLPLPFGLYHAKFFNVQLVAVSLIESGQGAKSGVQFGDTLVGVNGEPVPGDQIGFRFYSFFNNKLKVDKI